MRLVGGDEGYSGRVEVCVGGEWGTVCSEGFTQELAVVACMDAGAREKGEWMGHSAGRPATGLTSSCLHFLPTCQEPLCLLVVYLVLEMGVSSSLCPWLHALVLPAPSPTTSGRILGESAHRATM